MCGWQLAEFCICFYTACGSNFGKYCFCCLCISCGLNLAQFLFCFLHCICCTLCITLILLLSHYMWLWPCRILLLLFYIACWMDITESLLCCFAYSLPNCSLAVLALDVAYTSNILLLLLIHGIWLEIVFILFPCCLKNKLRILGKGLSLEGVRSHWCYFTR